MSERLVQYKTSPNLLHLRPTDGSLWTYTPPGQYGEPKEPQSARVVPLTGQGTRTCKQTHPQRKWHEIQGTDDMSETKREEIRRKIQQRLAQMDPATREAAIKKTQATMLLMNAAREAGYPMETKEQAKAAIEAMRKAVQD